MNPPPLYPEVAPLRQASRELVRELGFLQKIYLPAEMPHSHSHLLLELDSYGRLSQQELAERLQLDKSSISQIIRKLSDEGLVNTEVDPQDKRVRNISLTSAGQTRLAQIHADANQRVQAALQLLNDNERQSVKTGFQLYARALKQSRKQSPYQLRPIEPQDNPGVTRLIQRVMPEFGANGPGFAINDPEVSQMFEAYNQPRCRYFVLVDPQQLVVGGGGVAPLEGADPKVCELRKMYFMPEVRGLGLGQQMISRCLQAARELGFEQCYLETLEGMKQAQGLYRKNGFQPLCQPLGNTGHFGCDRWFLLEL